MKRVALVLALGAAALGLPRAAAAQDAQLVADGARIYGSTCMRCHNLRAPAEFSDLNWRTIMAQMRARANLTRSEARAVLAFVQATNGTGEGPSASPQSDNDAMGAPRRPVEAGAASDRAREAVGLTVAQRAALQAYVAKLRSESDAGR